MDNPRNHLDRWHGNICLGWVPWRALKIWGVLEELPEKLEDQYVMSGIASIDSRKFSVFTGDWTPFHEFQVAKETIDELSQIYEREEKDMIYLIWGNLILLRNIFFGRFGDDACKWWEYIQDELDKMRSEGLPADAIFFLTDVAFCEICHREYLISVGQEHEKGFAKIISALEKVSKEEEVRNVFFMNPLRKLWQTIDEQKKRLERWKSLMRFDEPEGYSPILHLVNTKIVEIFISHGFGVNEACRSATRLYLGFDLFGDMSKSFRFDRLKDDNKKSAIKNEKISRGRRVKRSYYNWKDRSLELVERIKHDYRGSGLIV